MQKAFKNSSKGIARLPQEGVQDGNSTDPQLVRQFIDGTVKKEYSNPSKVIARLPQGKAQDGNGKKPQLFRQFIDWNVKNIQESQQGISRLPQGECRTVMSRNHSFFNNSSMGM